MKVFLSGYGKMGRMLEELALERGWEVVGHADITCPEAYETAPGADVCLDFPASARCSPCSATCTARRPPLSAARPA